MRVLLPFLFAGCLLSCTEPSNAPSTETRPDTPTGQAQPAVNGVVAATIDTTMANGPVELKYPDGKTRFKGNMRDHKRHGMWTSYFPDGRPQSFSGYVNGELHGTTVVYHPNGTTYYTGDYRNGRQVGEWRFFDEKGELARTVTYDNEGTVINDRK
jgi:hypothetical protein